MGRLAIVRRVNVPISSVPLFVRQAFVATEDRRFFAHNGIDWRGFVRAAARNVRSFGVREGFSTITMQAARNSFVVHKYKNRSLPQKLIELRVARLMERSLTKDQILELYLNAIYMGNGVYGVEAASRDLFGKSVNRITLPEAAMLAALPKAPSAYTPRRNPTRAITRRNLVLSLMVKEGYVSADRLTGLQATGLRIARDEWRPDDRTDSFALDAVRALTDSVLSQFDEDAADLTVYTTLDNRAQIAADRAVARRASAIQNESSGYFNGSRHSIQGAMIGIDPRNGDIRALTGGRRYERGNYNRALKAKRQPGSAFKPFVYVTALGAGYSPASEVEDEPVEVVQGRKVWSPSNYNSDYIGLITFRRALMRSSNVAAVRVSQMVGTDRIIENAHRMGIESTIPNVPAIALGAADVTPIELVRAYSPFANGGFKVTPRLVKRIESRDGEVLWSAETVRPDTVMDPRDAYQLTSMLRGVVDNGTGRTVRDAGVKGPIAGKTGTTNNADRRLVRGLHADARRRRVVRLRHAAPHRSARVGRSSRRAGVGRLLYEWLARARVVRQRMGTAAGHDDATHRSGNRHARQRVVPGESASTSSPAPSRRKCATCTPSTSREDRLQLRRAEMLRRHLGEHRPEIRRQREIAAFVELLRLEARPLAVDLLSLHVAADHEQRAGVTVIRAAVAVLPHRAAELRHRHDRHVGHAVAEIGDERGDRLREVVEPPASWPVDAPWFTCVSQPPTSANATSRPTSDLMSCAICLSRVPNCEFG